MTRSIVLASALMVAIGAAMFVYQTLPEPVPEPSLDLHPRTDQGPPPKLEVVGDRTHHFGSLVLGDKGSHTWTFRNTGQGPLEVWVLETTCSCTVATLKSPKGEEGPKSSRQRKVEKGQTKTIAPGQSLPIDVEWETRKAGNFAQAATLGTSDPENPNVTLSILGKVLARVEVRPSESIAIPDASSEETRRASFEILSNDRPEMHLTKIATSRPGLIVAEARPIPPEELRRRKIPAGYTVAVEIKPGLPPGRFSEEVSIETDHPGQPTIRLALAGNTVGPISVVPARVGLPSVISRVGASQDLSLIVRGGTVTRFDVASKSSRIQVDIRPDEKPDARGRYRLKVTVPPGTPPGLVDEPIVLKTDHPRVKEVRIPVSIYVSNRSEGG